MTHSAADIAARKRLTRAVARALDCIMEARETSPSPSYLIVLQASADAVLSVLKTGAPSRALADYLSRGLRRDTRTVREAMTPITQALPAPLTPKLKMIATVAWGLMNDPAGTAVEKAEGRVLFAEAARHAAVTEADLIGAISPTAVAA